MNDIYHKTYKLEFDVWEAQRAEDRITHRQP